MLSNADFHAIHKSSDSVHLKNPSFWMCLQGTLEPALLQLLHSVEQPNTHRFLNSHRHQRSNHLFAKHSQP